ncbi:MAG TPA: ChbG/HpnK family deacetylase [Chloroflexi bacterium]|jgi:predicted glycoside hydrolase/deacetylase ChbG (UPF0249 family)|nr:ChbG/HpnK family deacetylase [Chloroflexota bacterium]HPO57749.1 polysaccharide deacetylase family protein [Anaerolineaceae bacterium]
MQPNPVLRKLGFDERDRLVILHVDDVGMCQASVAAFQNLWETGLVSSGSVMVPCPWFLEAARLCSQRPEIDAGVHLTLTSEWEKYRWGPVSTRDRDTGLLDEQGCFHRDSASVQRLADPEAAEIEMKAQVDRALAAGMRPTHLDTHMGAVAHLKFIPAYLHLALSYRLPPMLPRLDDAGWRSLGLDETTARAAAGLCADLEDQGVPLLDQVVMVPLDTPENRPERTRALLQQLPPGITHFIIHPAMDTPELRAITPDWACRTADFIVFSDECMRAFLRDSGLQVIGYRDLQALMPAAG